MIDNKEENKYIREKYVWKRRENGKRRNRRRSRRWDRGDCGCFCPDLASGEEDVKLGFIWTFVLAFLRCIVNLYFPDWSLMIFKSKKFSIFWSSSTSTVYFMFWCCWFKAFRNLLASFRFSNLEWLSSTYRLKDFIISGGVSDKHCCMALCSWYCKKLSAITTINARPIGPEFSSICILFCQRK